MFGWFTKKKNKNGEPPIVEITDQSMKVATPSLATTSKKNKIMLEKNKILAAKFLDDATALRKKKLDDAAALRKKKLDDAAALRKKNLILKENNKSRKGVMNQFRENTATDVMKEIDKHYPVLRRNLARAYFINEYGAVEKDEREQEFERFLTSVGYTILLDIHRPEEAAFARAAGVNLSKEPSIYNGKLSEKIIGRDLVKQLLKIVNKKIENENKEASRNGFYPDTIPENGHDFENWTADALSKFGWTAKATQGSGDQGIDVIADKKHLSVGIQCKLYSGSVGNKAVQEVLAGITHFGLDRGVVITNAKYTKSAVALARGSNILLLSHADIPYLESLLKK